MPNTMAKQAYEQVLSRILAGTLAPGARVSEQALADEIGLSRTPVREAVKRLTDDGIVTQVPRFGTVVRRIEPDEAFELYQVREALESHAASWAAEKISTAQLAQLRVLLNEMQRLVEERHSRNNDTMDTDAWRQHMALDKAFHLLIIEAAGNRQLLEIIRRKRVVSDLFRLRLSKSSLRIPNLTIDFHQRILDTLEKHDAEQARLTMADHIRAGRDEAMRHYRELKQTPAMGSETAFDELPPELTRRLKYIEKNECVNGNGNQP